MIILTAKIRMVMRSPSLSFLLFWLSFLPLQAQNFFGAEMVVNYLPENSRHEILLRIYSDRGLDSNSLYETINPSTGDPASTVGIDTVIEITSEISLYQYRLVYNFSNGLQHPFWETLLPFISDQSFDNLTEDCIFYLRPRIDLLDNNGTELNPTIAYWSPYYFDHYIDESGVFHMQVEGYDDNLGAVSYHPSLRLYDQMEDCAVGGTLDSLLLNQATGEFLWLNPQAGTFLIGVDLQEWYGDYLSPLSRFPRYLVITIEEDDIVSTSSSVAAEDTFFSLYPNPATHSIQVIYESTDGKGNLAVSNLTGQIIYQSMLPPTSTTTEIDVSTWPAGIYFLTLEREQGRVVRKLVVE